MQSCLKIHILDVHISFTLKVEKQIFDLSANEKTAADDILKYVLLFFHRK